MQDSVVVALLLAHKADPEITDSHPRHAQTVIALAKVQRDQTMCVACVVPRRCPPCLNTCAVWGVRISGSKETVWVMAVLVAFGVYISV